jgi:hypothetical protein
MGKQVGSGTIAVAPSFAVEDQASEEICKKFADCSKKSRFADCSGRFVPAEPLCTTRILPCE